MPLQKTKQMKKIFLYCCIIFFAACKKSSYLDQRPNQSLVIPTMLQDIQALLDNDLVMNGIGVGGIVPSLGEIATDEYIVNANDLYNYFSPLESNAYTWQQKVFNGEHINDWNLPYRAVFYANIALDQLQKIEQTNDNETAWNNIKGSALFYRAFMFYHLAQTFAEPYDSSTANNTWGIPLQLHADINEQVARSTLQETYDRIIQDLEEAITRLPAKAQYATRPSQAACYALLAKLYLTIGDYTNAYNNADKALQLQNTLLDYNTLDAESSFPIPQMNEETIFMAALVYHDIYFTYTAGTDSVLYSSYADNDLRKKLFFTEGGPYGTMFFRGSYITGDMFGGIATDEVYLIRAEANARKGNITSCINDLNTLLQTRYAAGTFTPLTANTKEEALQLALIERRKELIMRGTRWIDLRRLNKEGLYTTNLQRVVNGTVYTLPANDPRYTYPIPDEVIQFNPSMPQNPR